MKTYDGGVILLIILALVGGWFLAKNFEVSKKEPAAQTQEAEKTPAVEDAEPKP